MDNTQTSGTGLKVSSAPVAPAADSCVVVSSQTKTMSLQSCSEAFPFLCYKHNLVLVQEELSWEQALEACGNIKPFSNYSSTFRILNVKPSELQYVQSHAHKASTSKACGSWVVLGSGQMGALSLCLFLSVLSLDFTVELWSWTDLQDQTS
ncbi:hypothetical protein WMY93_012827 [Mugilogobius chulae]|uniref:C-type lectin domain-containing protein n=1 Tax=Mugilogobius chulae TaxID=88201 RepID=A0AAW0PA20_9GOBI